ncbi:hypothetical protein F0562_033243 [Nyssa sinensis]|uniref:Uncharacterized protein n=1 Tax=Nyssa sinensis TaxID=561372 RepID=A0A5J5ASI9_9ASTE|nr:hypothetical protein F0562_033243 [Nyssa sinensis]
METVRLRLVFEDRHILTKLQKSEGLKRSWLILKPEHETISDLSSYLVNIFDLDQSCPNGLLLSMDGFVLPPFESTCILKDKDIIRVKKKGGKSSDIIRVGDEAKPIEAEEIVEKQPVLAGVLLLANEEFEEETGGYQSEPEEDEDNQSEDTLHVENSLGGNATSKKRKSSQKLQSSKKKKRRPIVSDSVENDVQTEEIGNSLHDRALPGKPLHKKEKVSDIKSKPESAEKSNDIFYRMPTAKSSQPQENGTGSGDVSDTPDGTKKAPSRSARRKKAKRQWLRELAKVEKKELNQRQSVKKDLCKNSTKEKDLMALFPNQNGDVFPNQNGDGLPNQNNDVEDEIVPIVIRPGHIRFEPLGEDKDVQQNQLPVETFQWNGITSKKKGQKWGKEKSSNSNSSTVRRNDYQDFSKECSEMLTIEKEAVESFHWNGITSKKEGQKWGQEKGSNSNSSSVRRNDYQDFSKECSETMSIEKEAVANKPIDFNMLTPLANLPKEGDVIAYRLLELSSSWTPELSSFRVGKTSLYDPESNTVVLIPVPEYPIPFEKEAR